MLARRFTIICLVMSLFGMFFASLVAEAGRGPRQRMTAPFSCGFETSCYPSIRN